MKRVELLAPVGSIEALDGVINAGADAVYLAGKNFGARSYADNFSDDELIYAITKCHLFNVKVYLTLNTLIKEKEFELIYPFLYPLYENGLDGVIVQDLGVVKFISEAFPKLPIHLSTQMSICSSYATSLFSKFNVTRVVPARELSLSEIIELKENSKLEIECFIHGAMCYCYSGKCLFSAVIGSRSGNRGKCAQPCRLPYSRNNSNSIYPLSMKDMCTIEMIPQLIDAGIDSFKIEGRMKKPEFAAGVTSIYRKYIDKYYNNCFDGISNEDLDILSNLYIRNEKLDGYYNRYNGKEMITIDSPAYKATDEDLLSSIRAEYLNNKPKHKISLTAEFIVSKPIYISIDYNNIKVEQCGNIVQKALNAPISEDKLRKQLMKFGDTDFVVDNMSIVTDGNGFLPVKDINEVRRACVDMLYEELRHV